MPVLCQFNASFMPVICRFYASYMRVLSQFYACYRSVLCQSYAGFMPVGTKESWFTLYSQSRGSRGYEKSSALESWLIQFFHFQLIKQCKRRSVTWRKAITRMLLKGQRLESPISLPRVKKNLTVIQLFFNRYICKEQKWLVEIP